MFADEEIKDPEEEQDTQEPAAADQTPETEEIKENPQPRQPSSEIKVIIITKADSVMLGVQSPDCDPVYKTFKGTMADALQQVPAFIEDANRKWDANPRYPKANLPEPPPNPPPAARTTVAATPAKTKAQPKFF